MTNYVSLLYTPVLGSHLQKDRPDVSHHFLASLVECSLPYSDYGSFGVLTGGANFTDFAVNGDGITGLHWGSETHLFKDECRNSSHFIVVY